MPEFPFWLSFCTGAKTAVEEQASISESEVQSSVVEDGWICLSLPTSKTHDNALVTRGHNGSGQPTEVLKVVDLPDGESTVIDSNDSGSSGTASSDFTSEMGPRPLLRLCHDDDGECRPVDVPSEQLRQLPAAAIDVPSEQLRQLPAAAIAKAFSPSAATPREADPAAPARRKSRRIGTVLKSAVSKLPSKLPRTRASQRSGPLFTQQLENTSIAAIRAGFEKQGECVVQYFLREVMECFDLKASDLHESAEYTESSERSIDYKTPIPSDVPDTVRRLCRLPETILGTTLVRISGSENELSIVQHSYTHNVMYGDRFYLQNTISFEEAAGGVLLRQWTEVIWRAPLPWTHGIVKYFVERKAKSGARESAGDFARIIGEFS